MVRRFRRLKRQWQAPLLSKWQPRYLFFFFSLLTCLFGHQLGVCMAFNWPITALAYTKFSRLFALQDMTRALYNQVQVESRVPELQAELEKVRVEKSYLELDREVAMSKEKKLETDPTKVWKVEIQLRKELE